MKSFEQHANKYHIEHFGVPVDRYAFLVLEDNHITTLLRLQGTFAYNNWIGEGLTDNQYSAFTHAFKKGARP